MELKDISSESTVVFGVQSVPFDKEFEKGGVKNTCKVVKVGIGVNKEIFGDLAKKSGFFAEIFGLDAENHIDTCEWVFPKEVLVA